MSKKKITNWFYRKDLFLPRFDGKNKKVYHSNNLNIEEATIAERMCSEIGYKLIYQPLKK